MRYYSFTHFMLSSIQQGIQTAHVIHRTFVEQGQTNSPASMMLWEWARNHETIINLNGGNTDGLNELYLRVRHLCIALDLPYSAFNEDASSLNCSITAVGCVIPQEIYDVAATLGGVMPEPSDPINGVLNREELELAVLISSYPLAR